MTPPIFVLWLIGLVCLPFASAYAEDAPSLVVRPHKCVALRKGQVCYQRLNISFRNLEQGNYCLYVDDNEIPLKCWANARDGKLVFAFESDKSSRFNLLNDTGTLIASSQITVAWVYDSRTRRQNTWRLF